MFPSVELKPIRSPIVSLIAQWNDLDLLVRSAPSLSMFKYGLKEHYKREPHFLSANMGRIQVSLTQIHLGFSNLCSDLTNQDLKVKTLSVDKLDLNFVSSSVTLRMMSRLNCSYGLGKDNHLAY